MANADFQNGFINGFVAGSTNINVDMINRRDTEINWETENPVLLNGEQVIVDTASGNTRIKVGDGITRFADLPYIDEHIKTKLDTIEEGANKTVVDGDLDSTSTNAIQNKVVSEAINEIKNNIPIIPESLPANGGDSDTIDGKHASDFASAIHEHSQYANTDDIVINTRTINGKPLSADISLDYSDVGADPFGSANTKASEALEDAKQYIDSAISNTEIYFDEKLGAKANNEHNHDGVYDVLGSANTALEEANSYTDTRITNMIGDISVTSQLGGHNTSNEAHNDIRVLISDLTAKLNKFLNVSTDNDGNIVDELSDVITLIDNNKGTLESLTITKINVSDIIDNLVTASTNKVLSANQGAIIKSLIDNLQNELDSHTHEISDVSGLQSALNAKSSLTHTHNANNIDGLSVVATSGKYSDLSGQPIIPTKTSQLTNDSGFKTTDTTYEEATQSASGLLSFADKIKLDGVEEGANKTITDAELSAESENPIQNKVVREALDNKISFDEEIINSDITAIKVIPKGSAKYAAINKVGGMSYKSRNLLEITATTKTVNGVTFTVNTDGSVLARGTATALAILDLGEISKKLTVGKTYKMSDMHACRLIKADGTVSYPADAFVYTSDITKVYPYLQIGNGETATQNYYPMVIEATETNTSYEPYYSGIRSAEVTSITATGKNLLRAQETITVITATNILDYGTPCYLKANHTYTLSFTVTALTGVTGVGTQSFFYDNNGIANLNFVANAALGVRKYHTFTPTKDIFSMRMFFNGVGTMEKVMIEEGAVMTDYEPYKEKTLTIPTGARKIGYGLGINEDYYNYIDWERKVFVKRCVKLTGFTYGWSNTNTKVFRTVSGEIELLGEANGAGKSICSHTNNYGFHTNDNIHYYVGKKDAVVFLPIDTDDSVASEIEVIAALAIPEEIDISEYLPDDNFIEVAEYGAVIAVNEYNYGIPLETSFYISENPNKAMVADMLVGDLIGVATEAKTLTGLSSTTEELNYLHTKEIEVEGWIFPSIGKYDIDGVLGDDGQLGLKAGNTYTFTITFANGSTVTDTGIAFDASDKEMTGVPNSVALQGTNYEGLFIYDNIIFDGESFIEGEQHYWSVDMDDAEKVVLTGIKEDGNPLTHTEYEYGKIPIEHIEDLEILKPIEQYYEWTGTDNTDVVYDVFFEKPQDYNRCEIFTSERKTGSVSNHTNPMGLFCLPYNSSTGELWSGSGVVYTGEYSGNIYVGMGETHHTVGATDWAITSYHNILFTEKVIIDNWSIGCKEMSTAEISETVGYPPQKSGQNGIMIDIDNTDSLNSLFDSEIQWRILPFIPKKKGNYIKLVWYQN